MRAFQTGAYFRLVASSLWFACLGLCAILVIFPGGRGLALSADRPADEAVQRVWPQARSDLPVDEQMTFGQLANGLGYIIKENHTPRDRVSMHLYVRAGSLSELDQEQGVAHFLEHMLFNGSTHFAPGEMVKYFQRIGMQYGPDANAHTGFMQTVYDVTLPRGDEKSLAEGLLILRDYADGALLLPEEVEREKKVVLAEMRSRDSAAYRTLKSSFAFEMPALLASRRFPIGLESTITGADARTLRDFYAAWYRPEQMTLIMVGDLDTDQAVNLIARRFDDLRSMGPARLPVDFGSMVHAGVKSFYHREEESGSTSIAIEVVTQQDLPRDSAAQRRRKLLEDLANRMVRKRLDRIVQGPETVLTSAQIASGHYLGRLKYAEISAECEPDNWSAALSEIEQALRRALVHGFTLAELRRVKDEYLARLEKDAKQADTRESKSLTHSIIRHLNYRRVIMSPQQRLALLSPFLEKVSLKQVNRAFVDIWADDHRLVLVTGNAVIDADDATPEEKILTTYQTSRLSMVMPPEEKSAAKFPYLPKPADTGTVAHRESIEDLGIQQVLFANGVALHLKRNDYKDNEVLVALTFGHGKASEPADQPGLAMMTEAVVNESGFGHIDALQLREALAGKVARARLKIGEEMFVIGGESSREELPLLFQLLYAFVHDPGYRPEIRALALKRWDQDYRALARTPEGMLRLKARSFLAGGDSRFGLPPWRQLQARTIAQIRQWYGKQLRQAPMALSVVGDIDPHSVVALAKRYFGSMAKRATPPIVKRGDPTFPAGQVLRLSVDTDIPKALVVVAYATEDFWEIRRTRRLTIMAELLSERLRQRIREELGAAYSPYAYNRSHRAYAGYGTTQLHIQVNPAEADAIAARVGEIALRLKTQGVDKDEFRRILDPTLTHIKDLRQTNSYWLSNVLSGAERYPQQLEWSRTFASDYAAITASEVIDLAGRYLDDGLAATVIITPSR